MKKINICKFNEAKLFIDSVDSFIKNETNTECEIIKAYTLRVLENCLNNYETLIKFINDNKTMLFNARKDGFLSGSSAGSTIFLKGGNLVFPFNSTTYTISQIDGDYLFNRDFQVYNFRRDNTGIDTNNTSVEYWIEKKKRVETFDKFVNAVIEQFEYLIKKIVKCQHDRYVAVVETTNYAQKKIIEEMLDKVI
jgi:hypothetical protein